MTPSEIQYTDCFPQNMESMRSIGAFLLAETEDGVNTMTIGWATIGCVWGKSIMTVYVRPSRHTYQFIEKAEGFTVCFAGEDMKEALDLCGTKSGRDLDKFAAAGLELVPARKVTGSVIAGSTMVYECRTVYQGPLNSKALDPGIVNDFYGSGDFHTVYYGEILACYKP